MCVRCSVKKYCNSLIKQADFLLHPKDIALVAECVYFSLPGCKFFSDIIITDTDSNVDVWRGSFVKLAHPPLQKQKNVP